MVAVDDVEFNIVRKVLFIAVSTVKNSAVEMQLDVLSSVQLKDKEALEKFVRKNGLISLAGLLAKWEDQVEAEQGVLLLLKALAVLPGVTRDAIIESNIGKKKMKADVGAQNEVQAQSKSATGKSEGDKENRSRGLSSPRRSTSNKHRSDIKRDGRSAMTSSSRPQDTRPSKGKAAIISNGSGPDLKRSNSAGHLLNLMNSRNGRDASTARRDRDIFGNVQNKRRLGTANNWRARRSTVVLDQVSKRLTEHAQEVEVLKTQKVEEDDWQPSKISFAEGMSTCLFDKEVEVSKLLVYRPVGSTKAPEHPPVKPHSGPLRSILRVRLPPPIVHENTPRSSEGDSAPPTVQSTARPAIDRIVVPSERPSLPIEVSGDGTADESPMFSTSKLSKVVSPTEKRKQGFSPPPCIPTSEQPPLDFTEKDEESEDGEVSVSDDKNGKLEPELDAPKESSPSTPVEALSPVVSDDESSEEGEASSGDAVDSSPRGDMVAPASCSTEPKDGGAASMESPVQQAATTSA
uniref:TFIIS N-terminal domain-containing protein n=1 Tax=Phytophthora ramorum TaxID=164328 RepID=H3H5K1_PHYRM